MSDNGQSERKGAQIYVLDPGVGPLGSAKSCTSRRIAFLKDGRRKIWMDVEKYFSK